MILACKFIINLPVKYYLSISLSSTYSNSYSSFRSVNAITLLISLLSLGNSESRNEVHRLECIFDLMDFNHSGHISMDEFVSFFNLKIILPI